MKILIIDDESAAREKMNLMLSPYGDCDIAENGELAIQMYSAATHNENPYDLITIDVEMPGISGIQVLEKICTDEQKRSCPACRKIMVSGSGTRENIIAAAKYKCDGFLVKPVKRTIFEAKMEELGLQKIK